LRRRSVSCTAWECVSVMAGPLLERRPAVPRSSEAAVERGFTPNELARILRVSADRVRDWIRRGELKALNTAPPRCGRPRFIVLPHHLAEFERARQVVTPSKAPPRRRRRSVVFNYYPN